MKQIFTLLSFLVICGFAVQAQSTLTIDPCPVSKDGSIWELNKVQADLSNSASSSLDLAWERVDVDIPAGWSTSVCDPNQCYAPFSDEPLDPASNIIPFSIDASGTIEGTNFYCQFIPNGIAGTGVVTLDVYDINDPTNVIQCTFTLNATPTGIDDPEAEVVIMYPNPVRDRIFISAPASEQIASVDIYSIVGKRTASQQFNELGNKVDLDLNDLKEGMYFARVINSKGEMIGSKRFTKVN